MQVGAADRDQAAKLKNAATDILRLNKWLGARIESTAWLLTCKATSSSCNILAADIAGMVGVILDVTNATCRPQDDADIVVGIVTPVSLHLLDRRDRAVPPVVQVGPLVAWPDRRQCETILDVLTARHQGKIRFQRKPPYRLEVIGTASIAEARIGHATVERCAA